MLPEKVLNPLNQAPNTSSDCIHKVYIYMHIRGASSHLVESSTPVLSRESRVCPYNSGYNPLTGMSHQVYIYIYIII